MLQKTILELHKRSFSFGAWPAQVAEELLAIPLGVCLCKAAGAPRLDTFVWIEAAAVAGGLSTAALADAAAKKFAS